MTGAGSASVAVALEDSFRTLPGTPSWFLPGFDVEVGDASLNNQLQETRKPDDPRTQGDVPGNVETAVSLSFTLSNTSIWDLLLPTSGTDLATSGADAIPTATVYLASDVGPSTTEERFLEGAAVTSASISQSQGEKVTLDVTMTAAAELDAADANAPAAPSSISEPAKSDAVMWFDTDLSLAGSSVNKLQSATLELNNLARPERDQSRFIDGFVVGPYDHNLSFDAIVEGRERRELAYGSSGATSIEDAIAEQTASFDLGSTHGSLDVTGFQPNTYSYSALVDPSTSITDPIDGRFDDLTRVV